MNTRTARRGAPSGIFGGAACSSSITERTQAARDDRDSTLTDIFG